MRHIFIVLFIAQFAFLIGFAQITFTREWVTGKRSGPSSRLQGYIKDSRGQRLVPAIEYLVKNENIKKPVYAYPDKRYALPWRITDGVQKPVSGDPLKEDETIQYDVEIPNQKYKPSII